MKCKLFLLIMFSLIITNSLNCDWTPLGPISNIGCLVNCIKQDPGNHHILYSASQTEGIFKSTTNGETWFRVFDVRSVLSLGINPVNSDIIFAGTSSGIIYKSENAGEDWLQVYEHTFSRNVNEIVIDPNDDHIIYAAIETTYSLEGGGIIKSINSGEDWDIITEELNSKNFHALAIDYDNSNIIYAGSKFLYSCDGGFFKSEDGGLNWTQTSSESVTEIAIDIIDSSIVLMGTYWNGTFRSTDSGESWQQSSSENVEFFQGELFSITYDPVNTDIVYSGMNPPNDYAPAFYKSIDNGISWNSVTEDLNSTIVFSICINSDNNDLIHAATFNGHYLSIDAGITWSPANQGMTFVKVYNILINPQDIDTWTISTNHGIYVTNTAGEVWNQALYYHPIPCVYHPEDNTLWGYIPGASYSSGIYTSTDNGLTWHVRQFLMNSNYIAIHPDNPDIILVPTNQAILKSENEGYDWVNSDAGITEFPVLAVYYDGINPDIVYSISESNVWKSNNSGESWFNLNGPFDFDDNQPQELVINPQNTSELFIRTSSNLWKSINAGENWTEILLPATGLSSFCLDTINTNIIFTGFNESGVFISYDKGQNWESYNDNLINYNIKSFGIDPVNSSFILAGTNGDGIAYAEFEPQNSAPNEVLFVNKNRVSNFPNPFNPSTTIEFSIEPSQQNEQIELEIYNIKGQKIRQFKMKNVKSKINVVVWNGDDESGKPVSSGIYLYQLKIDGKKEAMKKCLLLK